MGGREGLQRRSQAAQFVEAGRRWGSHATIIEAPE